MSTIATINIDLNKLDKSKIFEGKKGKYYSLTLSINDESRFGNNISVMDSQTKEERDSKQDKNYLGNGKVVWTDGNIKVAEREEQAAPVSFTDNTNDLPF